MKKILWLKKYAFVLAVIGVLGLVASDVFAAVSTIGTIASNVTSTFQGVTRLITAVSYVTGIGFALGAITKFKQHKDNPAQIPIATPITLVGVSASLLFFPSVLSVTGGTLFSGSAINAGPSGIIFKS